MNILITGASKGIGRSIATEIGSKTEGNLIITSRDTDRLNQLKADIQAINNKMRIFVCAADISTEKGLKSLTEQVDNDFDCLDILINNAGALVKGDFEEIDIYDAKQVFEVNYFSPARIISELIPQLKKSAFAHVVNIGSMAGFQGSSKFPGLSHYSASKAAIGSLTECLAQEFREDMISFNCLAIGSVQTEMLGKAFPGFKAPLKPDEMAKYIADFALNGHKYFNGKVLPVSLTTP